MRAQTSEYARGTDGYRAPELIQDQPRYTNKVDIWGIGCIFYELVYRRKAVPSDLILYNICLQQKDVILPSISNSSLDEKSTNFIMRTLRDTLALTPTSRPAASELHNRFVSWRVDVSTCISSVFNETLKVDQRPLPALAQAAKEHLVGLPRIDWMNPKDLSDCILQSVSSQLTVSQP